MCIEQKSISALQMRILLDENKSNISLRDSISLQFFFYKYLLYNVATHYLFQQNCCQTVICIMTVVILYNTLFDILCYETFAYVISK